MKTTIYSSDIECESCTNALNLAFVGVLGFEKIEFENDVAVITHTETLTRQAIIKKINDQGYRASIDRLPKLTFFERISELRKKPKKYEVELCLFKNSALTFALLIVIDLFCYFAFLKNTPDFWTKYAWWIFYLDLSVVSLGAAIWHVKFYKTNVTCMVGMMIGMTFGMQTGMMLGTILSATNGLFVGGLLGMTLGVIVGSYTGRCCGVMGVMEGMMAGVMGGIMGSMIGTMFRVDHILWLMPPFMLFNILIIWGLSYMLFEEVVEHTALAKKIPVLFTTLFFSCLLVSLALNLLILFGPRTGLAALG